MRLQTAETMVAGITRYSYQRVSNTPFSHLFEKPTHQNPLFTAKVTRLRDEFSGTKIGPVSMQTQHFKKV